MHFHLFNSPIKPYYAILWFRKCPTQTQDDMTEGLGFDHRLDRLPRPHTHAPHWRFLGANTLMGSRVPWLYLNFLQLAFPGLDWINLDYHGLNITTINLASCTMCFLSRRHARKETAASINWFLPVNSSIGQEFAISDVCVYRGLRRQPGSNHGSLCLSVDQICLR